MFPVSLLSQARAEPPGVSKAKPESKRTMALKFHTAFFVGWFKI